MVKSATQFLLALWALSETHPSVKKFVALFFEFSSENYAKW